MINANKNKKVASQAADGTHMARVVGIVDLGHQPGYEYQGEDVPSSYKIEVTYELGTSLLEDGRPHWVSEEVKLSNHEASKLHKRLQTLDPSGAVTNDGKEVENLLNMPAMVDTKQNAKGYAQIKNVGGVPTGIDVLALQNPTLLFSTEEPDKAAWDRLPKFTKKKVSEGLDKPDALEAFLAMQGDAGDF